MNHRQYESLAFWAKNRAASHVSLEVVQAEAGADENTSAEQTLEVLDESSLVSRQQLSDAA